MKKNSIKKIKKILNKKELLTEDEIRSLMILTRKALDEIHKPHQNLYLTIRLFCDWTAHNEITGSNTGLRILAKINDTLVTIENSTNEIEVRTKISDAIGFSVLRKELKLFFNEIDITNNVFINNNVWASFITNLIEIIRDVPLSFPSLSKLDKTKQKIYNKIAKKSIRPNAGVISTKISLIKYPPPTNEVMCLTIKTADTTNIIIPLLIDVRL